MLFLNEKTLGNRVSRCEINAAISVLQRKGYACEYGPHCPGATAGIDKRHWRQAVAAAHAAAATMPTVRKLSDLPTAERLTKTQEICEFLNGLLCDHLFDQAVSA